jgi:hypothetical protein
MLLPRALQTTHFERNETQGIQETVVVATVLCETGLVKEL